MKNYLGYTQQELQQELDKGTRYSFRYDRIDKIFKDTDGIIKGVKLYSWNVARAGVGIARRGRHYFMNEKDFKYFMDWWQKSGDIKNLTLVNI